MILGTTPTHIFNIKIDPSIISKVRVLYAQDDVLVLTKEDSDCVIENNQIKTTLSQEDTFKFDRTKDVEIQLRVLTTENKSLVSVPKAVGIVKCLESEVFA